MGGNLLDRERELNLVALPKVIRITCLTFYVMMNNPQILYVKVCITMRPVSCVIFLDPSIMDSLKHKCFLEELLFWTIKYEFPQKMVTFLLNMLPDQDYKVCLIRLSVVHRYSNS